MALADVYELRVSGTLLTEAWMNVFHALRANSGYDAGDVGQALIDTVIDDWRAAVLDEVQFDLISVKSLGNPIDFWEADFGSVAGNRSGDPMPPHDAATVKFPRQRTDMHHGYKRFCGIGEGDVTDGALTAGAQLLFDAVGTALIAQWELSGAPGTKVANFVIVKRVLDSGQYRLPQNDGELVYYIPASRDTLTYVKTQNSRKRAG